MVWFVILGVTYAGGPKNECELFYQEETRLAFVNEPCFSFL
jgi:hypothetical protein